MVSDCRHIPGIGTCASPLFRTEFAQRHGGPTAWFNIFFCPLLIVSPSLLSMVEMRLPNGQTSWTARHLAQADCSSIFLMSVHSTLASFSRTVQSSDSRCRLLPHQATSGDPHSACSGFALRPGIALFTLRPCSPWPKNRHRNPVRG